MSTTPTRDIICINDVVVFKKELQNGWWKVELNGRKARIQLAEVKIQLSRTSSENDTKIRNKKLSRERSSKEKIPNGDTTGAELPSPLPGENNNNQSPLPSPLSTSGGPPNDGIHQQGTGSLPLLPLSTSMAGNNITTGNSAQPDSGQHKERPSLTKRASQLMGATKQAANNLLNRKKSKKDLQTDGSDTASTTTGGVEDSIGSDKDEGEGGDDSEQTTPKGNNDGAQPTQQLAASTPTKSSTRSSRDKNKKKTRKGKSSKSGSMTSIRSAVSHELREIKNDLDSLRTELDLVIKAYTEESGTKFTDQRLVIRESPEERILEKMLEFPYQSLFKLGNSKTSDTNIALAPSRPLFYKEILIPKFNLNVLSDDEKQKLGSLEFDVFPYKDKHDEAHVYLLLMQMFHELDLVKTFKIPEITLYRFLMLIARRYRDVPFHNFFHAFNVTQTAFFFLKTCQARTILGPLEVLSILISAICHDCDHPGLNNDFQRKAQTRIAHLHKKSILENHHYLQCMAALSKPETNILINLNQDQEDLVYIYLRDLILATDLAVHGIILKSITERKKILHKFFKNGSGNGMTEEDRKLIMCAIMKCSDLSNEIRKQNLAKRWAKMVIEEFFAQSDKEREMQLPITPFMDKHKIIIAKEQINFIEKLCMPLYSQISQVFPAMDICCKQLEENRDAWKVRLNLFFSEDSEEYKRLSNKSIWEREQTKTKGASLSATLAMRASSSQVPKPRKLSTSGNSAAIHPAHPPGTGAPPPAAGNPPSNTNASQPNTNQQKKDKN